MTKIQQQCQARGGMKEGLYFIFYEGNSFL
jgi:hypothetical protein